MQEFGIVHIFIGMRALKVDHDTKSPEDVPSIEHLQKAWTQRFRSLGCDGPKAEFKRLRTDTHNFIKS
jgi:hypothetical protein